MRQLGTLPTESQARRFAAWLVTQRIDAEVEPDRSEWLIWVRDEDKLPKAREALAHFQKNPDAPLYQEALKTAEALRRDEERKRREGQRNIVEMRGKWANSPAGRRAPVVMAMIAISVIVFLLTEMQPGAANASSIRDQLLFVNRHTSPELFAKYGMFASIAQGEVWRLVTPIFIHYGFMHIVFNVWMFFVFGTQVENRVGSFAFAAICLAIALISNVGQALAYPSLFGGMSGVVYGLLGYIWMKVKFDNSAGYQLHPQTIFIAMLWFVLCILASTPAFNRLLGPAFGNVANVAHAAGLFAGLALGYLPTLLPRR
jgi:GlpG protein